MEHCLVTDVSNTTELFILSLCPWKTTFAFPIFFSVTSSLIAKLKQPSRLLASSRTPEWETVFQIWFFEDALYFFLSTLNWFPGLTIIRCDSFWNINVACWNVGTLFRCKELKMFLDVLMVLFDYGTLLRGIPDRFPTVSSLNFPPTQILRRKYNRPVNCNML